MLPSIVHRLAKDLLPPIILERPLDVGLALFTVALTYLIAKLALRESRDTIFFSVAFPPESSRGWKGVKLARPSLSSHLEDVSLLPASSLPSSDTKYITCFDPSTNLHIATVVADSREAIDAKVRKADAAQKTWRQSSFRQRRKLMRSLLKWTVDNMEEISCVGARDTGKTMLDSAFGEILTVCTRIEWLLKHGENTLAPDESRPGSLILAHKKSVVLYEPLGTVTACVSWNYPFHNALGPITAALFAGNAIVVKCSEQVAWSSAFFINAVRTCIEACGFSPELVQLVVCYPEEASALTEHPLIRHITFIASPFIGSEQVARNVAASAVKNLVPCCMELGGKDPAILLPGADVKTFESTFMRSVFQSVGQGCIATERFIVHRSLLPALELALKTRIDALHLASSLPTDPSDRPIDCGSMISNARFDDLERRVQQAVKMGARLLCGGKRVDGERDEAFFEPTLLADVTMEMDVASEEVFGPILCILSYESVDEAVDIANSSRYGLGASVYGRNKRQCEDVAHRLECGMVSINDFGATYMMGLPFGGCKASGYGRFSGIEGLRGICNIKAISTDRFFSTIQTSIPPPVDYPVKSSQKSWQFVRGLTRLLYGSSIRQSIEGLVDLAWGSF